MKFFLDENFPKAAAGLLDETRAMMEVLLSIRRAGADLIHTDHAIDAAKVLG